MRPANEQPDTGFDGPEREPDASLLERAFTAANGDKARDLYEGRWQKYYGSQSEADFALCDMLGFYSDNRAQIARLFRASALGQRDKAQRDDYVASMLGRVFDRRLPPIDLTAVIANAKASLDAQVAAREAGLPSFDLPPDDSFPTFDVGEFKAWEVTPRAWFVERLIPAGNVTLLSGDGGSGKSLLAAQLCASTVLGRSWLASEPTTQGNALYVSAEDDLPEIRRRMSHIARAEGIALSDLRGLVVVPLADRDALLAVPGRARGTLEPTPLYEKLAVQIAAHKPALVVIDTLADTFGGNEIDRAQARQFIAQLRRLAIAFHTTVVVLAHPSQSGMTSGSGTSGSTGWSNSVRSRLYLRRDEERPDIRVLELMKSNYGTIGERITVQWIDGVFSPIGRVSNSLAHKEAAKSAIDELFLTLLADFTARGVSLSPSPNSPTRYAPRLMASHASSNGTNENGFKAAMVRLLSKGVIVEQTERRNGRSAPVIWPAR